MHSSVSTLRACIAATFFVIGPAAQAAAPAAVGKRALLTLNVQVEESGQHSSRSDGVDVKWSTRRVFDAKIELVATKAQTMSSAQVGDGSAYEPTADLAALQAEAEKCGDDSNCQMAVAMKMMASDGGQKMMAQAEAAQAKAPRYQTWKPAPKGGRLEVTGDYQEQWDGVFLTASRETRNCKTAFSGASITPKDRETLRTGLDGNHVEIDTQTGKSSLMLVIGSYVVRESKCHINDGGRISDENENKNLVFAPPLDLQSTGGWLAGGAAAGTAIARGELDYVTKPGAKQMSGMMSVDAPLKVKIRWELVPL